MTTIDKRIIKTKANIRDTLIQLLQTLDIQKITVTRIATQANIDRKTFYHHYATVYDVIKDIENELAASLKEVLESQSTVDIGSLMRGLNRIMNQNLDLYRKVAMSANHAFLKEPYKAIIKKCLFDQYYAISGMSKPHFNVHVEYFASGLVGVYMNWLKNTNTMTLEELTTLAENVMADDWQKLQKVVPN